MTIRRSFLVLLLPGCLLAVFVPGAQAEYQGTPGKIAYVDGKGGISAKFPLKIWDPAKADPKNPSSGITTAETSTFRYVEPGAEEVINGEASTPVFSPDGTKIAYSALIPDPGIPHVPGYHSAIFVMNADGTGKHEITEPPEAVVPPPECETCPAHVVADFMPTWSPDGKTIAFIRQVGANQYDSLYPARAQNIWTVPASGGAPTRLTNGGTSIIYDSVVWGAEGMVTAFSDSKGQELGAIASGASAPSVIASPKVINDYDVSPDGRSVTYTTTGASGTSEHVIGIDGTGDEVIRTGPSVTIDRYSNTGNGPLRTDCRPQVAEGVEFQQCGIFEEHTPDPGGDIRSDEPRDRFMLGWVDYGGVVLPTSPTRSLWDVQAQQLPIVFIPGFLGSEITGCGGVQWFTVPPDLEGMRLGPDGETDDGCPTSAADGKVVKFYKDTAEWIKQAFGEADTPFGCERANVLGWDWRKAPKSNLEAVGEKITEALERDECAEKEGAKRVVIMAHSYGGLLTRAYIDDLERANRVARVLTVGTPYWGSPKSVFPPAFGIEMPYNKDNLIFNEEALKIFSDNLAGLMQLFPSNSYGPWLNVNGETFAGIGAQPFLASIGVSGSLFGQAQANHDNVYDEFTTDYGQIDYRQVVGTGLATVGSVQIEGKVGGEAQIHMGWVNGDGTVPGTSATTGPIGSQPPDTGVHIQDICDVEHMEETEYQNLRDDYFEFLDHDRIPLKTEGSCPFHAHLLDIANSSGTLGPPSTSALRGRTFTAVASGPMTLEQAYLESLIELYPVSGDVQALLDETKPVDIGGEAKELTFTVTTLGEGGETEKLQYGPLTGPLEIDSGGGSVSVMLDGLPVSGTPVVPPVEEGTGGSPAAAGSSGKSSSQTPVAAAFAVRKVTVYRGGDIRLSLSVPGKGVVMATGKLAKKGKRELLYGSAKAKASVAGPLQLTVKPRVRAKVAISKAKTRVVISVSFLPVAGPRRTLSASAVVPRLRSKHALRHG